MNEEYIIELDNTRVAPLLSPKKVTVEARPRIIQQPVLKSDNRTSWEKLHHRKIGEAKIKTLQREELKDKTNKAMWGTIGLGALAAAQLTPAAPYIDAAFAVNGAHNLSDLYDKGTLGLNLETVGNALLLVPLGLQGVPYAIKGYNYAATKLPKIYNTIASKSPIFIPVKDSFTRGIGRGTVGISDAAKSGLIRGNPVGSELTAARFGKIWRGNRHHFKDVMQDTKIPNIETKYFSKNLTENEFNAIKESAKKFSDYVDPMSTIKSSRIRIASRTADPLEGYENYREYLDLLKGRKQYIESFPSKIASGEISVNTTLSKPHTDGWSRGNPIPGQDLAADGYPLSYWYPDGRNPLTKGHDYAGSDWGIRVLNANKHLPFMHEDHLHPSFFNTIKLSDSDVQVFKRLPLGLTLRVPKSYVMKRFNK